MKKKRTVKYMLMLLGLVIFLAAYFLVYMDFTDRTDKLTSESRSLSDRLGVLQGYDAQRTDFETGIEADKAKIAGALSKYYTLQTPEDFIMLATAMENAFGVSFSGLSFEEPVFISEITALDDAGDYISPAATRTLTGYGLTATLEGTMTYAQMKDVLDYIYKQADATSLDTVELSYDSTTGLLLGSLVIDKYYLTGRDLEPHQPNIQYTDIGNDTPMGG
jgi:hypothetical protein